jgi:DNA polymerase sigma
MVLPFPLTIYLLQIRVVMVVNSVIFTIFIEKIKLWASQLHFSGDTAVNKPTGTCGNGISFRNAEIRKVFQI